jgi:hypothetical protein
VNKKRLLKLADLLVADARRKKGIKFDMTRWGMVEDEKTPLSCGTTACAMGLAALSGEFRRMGLGYNLGETRYIHDGSCVPPIEGRGLEIWFKKKSGRKVYGGMCSAAALFDISINEVEWLFVYAYGYENQEGAVSEREVARRIRHFVAGKEAPPKDKLEH